MERGEQHQVHASFIRSLSFASHEKYGYSLKYAEKELRAAGDLAKKLGHRLTMHPGQFTQLGSNRPEVIEASIRDLTSHCEMLDLWGWAKTVS